MKKTVEILALFMNLFLVALWISIPDELTINISYSIATLIVTAVVVWWNRRALYEFVIGKTLVRFFNNVLTVSLAASIVSMLCYLSYRNFAQIDISKNQVNSLSNQTKTIIGNLKQELKIELFAKREDWPKFLPWIELYKAESKLVKVDSVDLNIYPHIAKSQGIFENGMAKITYGAKSTLVRVSDELSLTNALLKLMRTDVIKIYFSKGHGELSLDDNSLDGISFLKQQIEASSYQVHTIELAQIESMPADAHSLVILGPQNGFSDKEVQVIDTYLQKGGRLIFAYGPMFKTNYLVNLFGLFNKWGIRLNNDLVVDRLSTLTGADASIPMITHYDENHAITKSFGNTRTIFPLSSSVDFSKESKVLDGRYTQLAITSAFPSSWAESNLKEVEKGKVEFGNTDQKGPVSVAVVAEIKNANPVIPSAKLAVFGTSSFIVNGHQNDTANFHLFLNTLSWSVDDDGLIALNRPTLAQNERLFLSNGQVNLIFYASVIVIPLMFFISAIIVYRRRLAL